MILQNIWGRCVGNVLNIISLSNILPTLLLPFYLFIKIVRPLLAAVSTNGLRNSTWLLSVIVGLRRFQWLTQWNLHFNIKHLLEIGPSQVSDHELPPSTTSTGQGLWKVASDFRLCGGFHRMHKCIDDKLKKVFEKIRWYQRINLNLTG